MVITQSGTRQARSGQVRSRPVGPRQVRDLQRVAHLLAGVMLVTYVYAAPLLGAGFTAVVQWVIVPGLVLSGLALWKWHKIRAALRSRRAEQ